TVRSGNTPTPDGTWSAFVNPSAFPITNKQYVQYQAVLTTSNPSITPELQDLIITTDHAPVAVNDSATTLKNTSKVFPAGGAGSLTANDTDADLTPAQLGQLRIVAVTQPAHGTVVLVSGQVTYTPATNYTGPDAFTYTISDGLLKSTATVSMTVTEAKIDTAMLITWPNPAPITYGTPLSATQLNATINNVPGTFSYNPGIGTVLNAGASQMLTATFTPTDQTAYTTSVVAAFITVNPAQLTVTADNKSRGYGAANPALTATITGFTNGETLATSGVTGTPALSTTATSASAFGNYPITAAAGTLAASNYTFAFVNGTLSVTKVGLTITADNKTKVFGAANPT